MVQEDMVGLATCSARSKLSMLSDIFVVKPTITASAVGKAMSCQWNSVSELEKQARPGKKKKKTQKKEKKIEQHPKFEINICSGKVRANSQRRVVRLRRDVRGSVSDGFYFLELRCNDKPIVGVPKQGRGWWFGFFPPFPALDLSAPPLFFFATPRTSRAGASRAELSDPANPSTVAILADHTCVIHHYFWTQTLRWKRFKILPNALKIRILNTTEAKQLTS